ncbi:MAG: DUF502 domain-containing protein [Planctomycetes bacterium]|nr:DUF502 domain-containing protein [Planctomycetota bacterium]
MSDGAAPEASGPPPATDIVRSYKRVFTRGLATILPTVLTLWIVIASYSFVEQSIAQPIADGIKSRLVETELGNAIVFSVWDNLVFLRKPVPTEPPAELSDAAAEAYRVDQLERIAEAEPQRQADLRNEIDQRFPKWVGFLLAVVAVFVVGFVMASFMGSWLWGLFENYAGRIPLVRNIYPGAKQMVNFFLSSGESSSFQAVVAVEFPRAGLWSIGFLTSDDIPEISEQTGETVRGVYLGTPAAGQVVLAKQSEIVAIDMTVDEALKFLMSGGVIGRDPGRPPQRNGLPWQSQRLSRQASQRLEAEGDGR